MRLDHCVRIAIATVTSMLQLASVAGTRCKWSNEECDINFPEQCCSKQCKQAHPGTNARCRESGLLEPCMFRYHCSFGLRCGRTYQCCAQFWEACHNKTSCCDSEHICVKVSGFVYKRCLFSVPTPKPSFAHRTMTLAILAYFLSTLFMQFLI